MRFLITGGAGFIGSNAARPVSRARPRRRRFRQLLAARRPRFNRAWLETRASGRPLHPGRRPRRRGPPLRPRRAVRRRPPPGRPGRRDDLDPGSASTDLRHQRARHVQAARGAPPPPRGRPGPGAASDLRLDQQGLRPPHAWAKRSATAAGTFRIFRAGVSEAEPLSFESPYGCSKGAADQYVVDYHRSYGLPTVAMRQSCIYGPRQFGEEDQGWVAWFALAAIFGLPITFYGDGLQVRDLLWVEDLVALYLAAAEKRATRRRPRLQRGRRTRPSACRSRSSSACSRRA